MTKETNISSQSSISFCFPFTPKTCDDVGAWPKETNHSFLFSFTCKNFMMPSMRVQNGNTQLLTDLSWCSSLLRQAPRRFTYSPSSSVFVFWVTLHLPHARRVQSCHFMLVTYFIQLAIGSPLVFIFWDFLGFFLSTNFWVFLGILIFLISDFNYLIFSFFGESPFMDSWHVL